MNKLKKFDSYRNVYVSIYYGFKKHKVPSGYVGYYFMKIPNHWKNKCLG